MTTKMVWTIYLTFQLTIQTEIIIMVTREWIERPQLHPSLTKLFICVTLKTANVHTHQRDPKEAEG